MTFLTQFSERVSSRRGLSVVSIVGIVLVPFVIAGILVWALWNPQDRLDRMQAAIVNNDQPVKLNGQTVPLGRELSSGLVGTVKPGSAKAGQNFSWVITDKTDAADGLDSGKYTAVITIPKDFSAAATSTADAATARKATIQVQTSDSSKLLDQTISQTIATTAASMLGNQLTASYLDNVYLGFNTLGDKLGEAASGAQQLADQGSSLASGAQQAADGQAQLASGQRQLADGLTPLASGASSVASGVSGLAGGVQQLSDGAQPLASGAQQLASGLDQLNSQTAQLSQLAQLGQGLSGGSQVVDTVEKLQSSGVIAGCTAGDQTACAQLSGALTQLTGAFQPGQLAQLGAGLQQASGQVQQLAQLPGAISQLSSAADQLATGTSQLASGLSQSASGAQQLAGGANQVSSGLSQTATAAQQLASGSTQAADGSAQLADGVKQYTDGTTKLADGLGTAVKSIPSYTDAERANLSKVVATPVGVKSAASAGFGALAAPLFGVLALWLGALACFIVLRPVTVTALGSPRSSIAVALRGLVLPGLIGVVQGVAVAGALQPLLQLDAAGWLGLAGVGALAGVAFAAVNQALVAVFGGTGRFVSLLVILLGLATSLVGTAPQFMSTLASFTPIVPAQHLVEAVVQGTAVSAGSVVGLVLWLLGALAATTLAVARGRVVPASKLAPPAASVPQPA
ncbi:YhgE/Pip domain-containing protein [Gryllotalpicola koreensis]|uniref:YhgE/Pip domain-containing protein n=1 Tax=Gryllotalpicola koreensis TaxID=993086 RepID=A0ABP8AC42_9MICO